jgi:hypothetical protein
VLAECTRNQAPVNAALLVRDTAHAQPASCRMLLSITRGLPGSVQVGGSFCVGNANTWRTERLEGVPFLRRFLQHVLPRGFHKVRYYGLWHPSKRSQSNRAWVLLTLEALASTPEPRTLADLLQASSQGTEEPDQPAPKGAEEDEATPRRPHCGSKQTRLLGEWSRCGAPRVTQAG